LDIGKKDIRRNKKSLMTRGENLAISLTVFAKSDDQAGAPREMAIETSKFEFQFFPAA
jgi:hypothetical protein